MRAFGKAVKSTEEKDLFALFITIGSALKLVVELIGSFNSEMKYVVTHSRDKNMKAP